MPGSDDGDDGSYPLNACFDGSAVHCESVTKHGSHVQILWDDAEQPSASFGIIRFAVRAWRLAKLLVVHR